MQGLRSTKNFSFILWSWNSTSYQQSSGAFYRPSSDSKIGTAAWNMIELVAESAVVRLKIQYGQYDAQLHNHSFVLLPYKPFYNNFPFWIDFKHVCSNARNIFEHLAGTFSCRTPAACCRFVICQSIYFIEEFLLFEWIPIFGIPRNYLQFLNRNQKFPETGNESNPGKPGISGNGWNKCAHVIALVAVLIEPSAIMRVAVSEPI